MNPLKLLLPTFLLLILGTRTNAQLLIEVNQNGYFIDNHKIEYPMTLDTLKKVFGKQYRTFNGINTIYTYDLLGLRLYQPYQSTLINSLYFDFANEPYKFSPKHTFDGSLTINGQKIDKTFKKDSLAKIPSLFFDINRRDKKECSAVTFNDVNVFFSFNDTGNISSVSISFLDKGSFEIGSQGTDSKATFESIFFEYEKGTSNNEGKKVGIWEYYDNANELSLKYNHDIDTILYQKKTDDEFVIKDGAIWERTKLEIYPRLIGSYVEFKKSLARLIHYPVEARNEHITGTVYISFVIDKNSNLQDVNIEKDIGGNCGAEVVKALTSSNFLWIHAVKNNIGYDSKFIIPVTFVLNTGVKDYALTADEKLSLPDANGIAGITIVAIGVPFPIKN